MNLMTKNKLDENKWLIIGLHLSFWVVAWLIFVIIINNILSLQWAMYRSAVNVAVLSALFYLNILLVKLLFNKQHYLLYFIVVILSILTLTELRVAFNLIVPGDFYNLKLPENTRLRIFAYTSSFGVIVVSTLYQILQNRAVEMQNQMALQNRYQEAQVQFLKAQINPHFLFNTLNNIYSLAVMKSDVAPEMILKLSELLRYVIYEGQAKQVILEQEILHIQKFIELFQMRSETPLNIILESTGDISNSYIEPMILIPIVENCFKHCDFDLNEKAFAHISIHVKDQKLVFKTLNSKNDLHQQKDKMGGVGLENIKQRLELRSPKKYELNTKNLPESFEVSLSIEL
ncbi:MAG: hypothetical protein GY810_27390 [Aureispira sp.]|nr:hypothetical protein [Aureispira sp.]